MTDAEHHLLLDELFERRRRRAKQHKRVEELTKELDAQREQLSLLEQLEKVASELLAAAATQPSRVRANHRDSRHYFFEGPAGEAIVPVVQPIAVGPDGVTVPGTVSRDSSR